MSRSIVLTLFFALVACSSNDDSAPETPADDDLPTDEAASDTDEPAPVCTRVQARPGTVITTTGAVTGVNASAVWSWKGIPYAAPPVGALRWSPPVPAMCWSDELQAAAFGPKCPQLDEDGAVVGDEDCLTLNVWAPEAAVDAPVMVFIHGGGNVVGSAADPLYDGAEMARHTGAVVVTMEYRLGALGFFTHPALDAESAEGVSGNYGFLDQIAALAWVRDNIVGFGGSPQKVLVFGESAGGQDTLAHLASPLSKGLFQAAIVESGGVYETTIAEGQEEMAPLVEAVDCAGVVDVAACLRSKTAEVLAAVPSAIGPLDTGFHYNPVIDGHVFTGSATTMLAAGTHNHVPFIIGTNADETATMVPNVETTAQYEAFVKAQFGIAVGNELLTYYPADDYASPRKALTALTTDVIWTCPARRLARLATEHQTEPVYRYHFTWKVPGAPGLVYGSAHGLELAFVFRSFDAFEGFTPTQEDYALSEAMQGHWVGLIDGGVGEAWPQYIVATDPYLELDTTITAKAGIATTECDYIDTLSN